MQADTRKALVEGVADALGFVLGALVGWWVGRHFFGIDFVADSGWGPAQFGGLLLILVGTGLGRWLMRTLLGARKGGSS
jgi:hypothetical protein